MKVFKFGGGVLKTKQDIDQMICILNKYKNHQLIIVVSAFNKMTSKLEDLLNKYFDTSLFNENLYHEIKDFHYQLANSISSKNSLIQILDDHFSKLESIFTIGLSEDYHYEYDRIVSYGEILSSEIVYYALNTRFEKVQFEKATQLIQTDSAFTEAKVNWVESINNIKQRCLNSNFGFIVTQGFIASDTLGNTTTLGREGSDFSASVLAYALNAEEVIYWKEVKGVYNADPTLTEEYELLPKLSYRESVEQAFYGAKILHPKTIKPLQNKSIPIKVKPFHFPEENGTDILDISEMSPDAYPKIPIYIVKENQILISLSTLDFSFISENNLSKIFNLFSKYRVKVNLMESSAISFSICVNNDKFKIPKVLEELKTDFSVLYNDNLSLITIRHYKDDSIHKMITGKIVLLKQSSRHTVRFVLK
jgi:aspartate kinase